MKKAFVVLSFVLFTGTLTTSAIAAVNGNKVELKKHDDKKKKKKSKKGSCCAEKSGCAAGEKKSCNAGEKK